MKFLTNLVVTAITVYALSKLLTPHVEISSFATALIFSLVLAFMNAVVKPLLIILTLPLTIITLGLFLLVINVLIILMADHFVPGITIDGFFWALVFGLLLSVASSVFQKTGRNNE